MLGYGWIKRFGRQSGTAYAGVLAIMAGAFAIFVLLPVIAPYVVERAKSDFEADLLIWVAGSMMLLFVLICVRLNGRSFRKQFNKGIKYGGLKRPSEKKKKRWWRR